MKLKNTNIIIIMKNKGKLSQSLIVIISENYSPFRDLYDKNEYPKQYLFFIIMPDIKEVEICLGKKKDYTRIVVY